MIDYIKQKRDAGEVLRGIPRNDLAYLLAEINKLPPNSKILEVGTFAAGTTRSIAMARPDCKVFSVDINKWRPGDGMLEAAKKFYNLPHVDDDIVKLMQQVHIENLHNVTLLTGRSLEVDMSDIDFLYLDGDHSFETVIRELRYFWKRVKENGVIMGDDVQAQDVHEAVRLFCFENDLEVRYYSKQFKILKNSNPKDLCASKSNLNLLGPKRMDDFKSAI